MNFIVDVVAKSGLLKNDLDYNLIRASMVIIFLFFGYQKWFQYEADVLIPYISNGPLISWMYPVFGIRGASTFLGVSEWTFGALIFAGFWNKKLGVLGALGSIATFVGTITIIPFMPDGFRRRISRNGWQRTLSDEGCRVAGSVGLPAQTGRAAGTKRDPGDGAPVGSNLKRGRDGELGFGKNVVVCLTGREPLAAHLREAVTTIASVTLV
jgi:uncharacterized membrane protein YkgB